MRSLPWALAASLHPVQLPRSRVCCRLLANKPPIVVATPGRLWELLRDGEPHLATLASLRFLVLDEADRMVQAGHFQVHSLFPHCCPCMRLTAWSKLATARCALFSPLALFKFVTS